MILHELAHAYHHQVLKFDYKGHKEAFSKAHYEKTLHINGRITKHYTLTDHKEYFAEGTEAFFGSKDFYPFVKPELKRHDPELYKLLEKIWK